MKTAGSRNSIGCRLSFPIEPATTAESRLPCQYRFQTAADKLRAADL
jgi:hypothetical protein